MVRLGLEVLDGLGQDPGPGREDEPVVGQDRSVGQGDGPGAFIDPMDGPDDEVDPRVQEGALALLELLGSLAAHRDVHEAGLVDVGAGRVDDGDLRVAASDLLPETAGQEVRGQGAPDPAPHDEDALHRVYRAFSTMIRS